MVLAPSLNPKLVVRKWIVLLGPRLGNQHQAPEIPEVLKEDCHVRVHLFGWFKVHIMKHLAFAWNFTRQREHVM